jgi:hypothetical protein
VQRSFSLVAAFCRAPDRTLSLDTAMPNSHMCADAPPAHLPGAPGIPVGDLFVNMESWEEPDEVARAMGGCPGRRRRRDSQLCPPLPAACGAPAQARALCRKTVSHRSMLERPWTKLPLPFRLDRSLEVILEIEAEAAKSVREMPGLYELMATLRDREVRGRA